MSNCLVQVLKEYQRKEFDEYTTDVGYASRIDPTQPTDMSAEEEMNIVKYPAVIATGSAGRKLKTILENKLQNDRSSVLAMRFTANLHSTNDILSSLASIPFQECSGLEVSLPVVVDCLLSSYIETRCPRTLFRQGNSHDLADAEATMLIMALCTVYTVVTRCRGPLIWIETDNVANEHPLLKNLAKKMEHLPLQVSFLTKASEVTDELTKDLFDPPGGDISELDRAWDEEVRKALLAVKTSMYAYQRKATDVISILESNKCKANITKLNNLLKSSTHHDVTILVPILSSFESILSFHSGDWLQTWNNDLRNLITVADNFPSFFKSIVKERMTKYSLPNGFMNHISKRIARICSCGESPLNWNVNVWGILKGPAAPLTQSNKTSESFDGGYYWVLSDIKSLVKGMSKCIVDGLTILSPISPYKPLSEAALLYRFSSSVNITICKAEDGWLEISETAYDSSLNTLIHSCSSNAGMRCRCRKVSRELKGFALSQSYGQFVTCPEPLQREGMRGGSSKFGVMKAPPTNEVILTPSIDDEEMITFLSEKLKGVTGYSTESLRGARIIWNNLFGGRFFSVAMEAKLQRWSILSVKTNANTELELVKRHVEAHIAQQNNGAALFVAADIRSGAVPSKKVDELDELDSGRGNQRNWGVANSKESSFV